VIERDCVIARISAASIKPAFLLLSIASFAVCATDRHHGKSAPPPIAIEHVTVLPMTAAGLEVLPDTTVVIRGGRIESIAAAGTGAPARAAKFPHDARRVDGAGKWLMPALVDCHVHVENDRLLQLLLRLPSIPDGTVNTEDILLPYVANGVLQVINMSSMTESVRQRNEVESGRAIGPHMALASMVDGAPPIWPVGMTRVATTPEEGRQVVRDIKAEGHDYVKAYSGLKLDTFTAIVDEARRQQMSVVGHIPGRGQGMTAKYLQPGFTMVAHAEEFAYQSKTMSDAEIAEFVRLAKHTGVWLTATLTVDQRILEQVRDPKSLQTRPEIRYISPGVRAFWLDGNPYLHAAPQPLAEHVERVIDFNTRLVKAFAQAGIPVVAGTDSLVPGVVPGFALHDELSALARAGMTNEQVLAAATRLPAQWLGVAAERGTVEAGKRADLLLLDADPLADVDNTRNIAAVISGGRYLPRSDLDAKMLALAARNAAAPRIHLGSDGAKAGGSLLGE
jgi:imidazolonepropionase-like amidohydrolase